MRKIFLLPLMILFPIFISLSFAPSMLASEMSQKHEESKLTLEIKDNVINLRAENIGFMTILQEIEKQSRIKVNIHEDVYDRKVSLTIEGLPTYAISTLLEQMKIENFALLYDKELDREVIYVLPYGVDLSEAVKDKKDKTIIRPARFVNDKKASLVKGKEILIKADGADNMPVRYVKDELILRFHRGATQTEIEALINKYNLIPFDDESLSRIGYIKVRIPDGRDVHEVMKEIGKEYKIRTGEPNYISDILTITEPLYKYQWYVPDTKFDKAWDKLLLKNRTKVAVIDTGVDENHPDLQDRILGGYDFVDDDFDPSDKHGHGTFVAGIISANSNGRGIKGLYDYADIIPVRVMNENGTGTYEDVAKGIIFAVDNGAKVINLSLGGYAYSFLLQDAVDYALENGCLVVASGGNDGLKQGVYPAAYPDVMGVSAMGQNGLLLPLSNSGKHIDVAAPGENIVSTGLNGEYVYGTGTSASTAMVSALTAMLLSENPDLSSSMAQRLIMQSARDLGVRGRDGIYGYGEIDADSALNEKIKPFHDIAVRSVHVEPLIFEKGKPTGILIHVQNTGTFVSETFGIGVYEITTDEKIEIGKREGIVITDKAKIYFDWKPGFLKGNAKFEVIVSAKGDSNESNNSKIITLSVQESNGLYVLHSHPAHQIIGYKAYSMASLPPHIKYAFTNYIGPASAPANSDYDSGVTITEGTYDEDYPDMEGRWLNHFWYTTSYTIPHAPIDPEDGWILYQSAYRTAQTFWDDHVLPFYTGKDRYGSPHAVNVETSFWWLGRVAHLLTDMAVPAHVHNDEHIFASYETYVSNNCSSDATCGWSASGSPTSTSSLYDLFLDMAEVADNYDSEDENGEVDGGSRRSCILGWCTISDANYQIIADALMPEAIRHVAGLYQLFWDSTHGFASVSNGVTVTPSPVILGQDFTVSFTLKEVRGAPVTFEEVAVAILRSDDSLLFDLIKYPAVTIPANGTWSQSPTGQIFTTNPPGAYKAVIRGRLPGGDWFDFSVTGSGVNLVSFTAQSACTEPSITAHPQSQTIQSGQTASMWVSASGTTPFGYQWYLGSSGDTSNPISGAITGSWTTPALTQTTSYWVRVTNSCGSENSSTATVTVAAQGSIRVSIVPQAAADAGAQWKLTNDATWYNSGNIIYNLPFGTYQVEFKTIPGWNTPPNKEVTISVANPEIWIDSDPYTVQPGTPGTLQFSSATYSVNEKRGSVLITVTRTGGSSGAVGVSYGTSDGTATSGSDYTSVSGTLSWSDGDAENKTFSVPILIDSMPEGKETVNLALSPPSGGATLGSPSTAVLNISDLPLVDFDGDGKTDITVWRPGDGYWYTIGSKDGSIISEQWGSGALGDIAVAGDYDGDGKTDCAVMRPGDNAYWYIYRSSDGGVDTVQWGSSALSDKPVPGDYDGDGITDIAVWRPEDGFWHIISSKDGSTISQQWGAGYAPYNDVPVPGDYDGDGKTDYAVWRPGDGFWYIVKSSDGSIISQQWGSNALNDVLVPGDYDGDGKTDIAVWRPAEGYWYVISSKDGSIISHQWGAGYAPYNDVPAPGDFDGDGLTDFAVWRPGDGYWYILKSSDGGVISQQWGWGLDPINDEPISQKLNW